MEPERSLPPEDRTVGALESDVGPEAYQQLLADFLGHLPLQVAELHNAAAAADIPAARYVAHQIKGTAPSFGALHLDELADRLLRIARNQQDRLQPLVDEIDAEATRLQADGPHGTRV
jgi:HPt (histidine-containing phosphotransfer) domain-containing protein